MFRLFFLVILFYSCSGSTQNTTSSNISAKQTIINPEGDNIYSRINAPKSFKIIKVQKGSFQEYLRNLPLKPNDALVKYFNGSIKYNNNVYCAVVDLDIGKKNLHQCADAVMRLRAEYLWRTKQYNKIHFNFTNGFRVDYYKWMTGNRIVVKGNKSYWVKKKEPSNTYDDFWEYMEIIFMYAGTLSLSKELKSKDVKDLTIGDVFIYGGTPGHSVIVVDVAINNETKEKLFLLAQSYMPAQEIQILINSQNNGISPWFSSGFGLRLVTPEWDFTDKQLMTF